MRPIHLGLATLVLAAALAVLWYALDAAPRSVHAGSSAHAAAGAGGIDGAADGGREGSDDEAGSGAARTPLAAAAEAPVVHAAPARTDELPRLSGRVVDPAGQGVPGASVFASSGVSWIQIPLDVEPEGLPKGWIRVERATTDAEGSFEIAELKPGPLRVAVRASGFAPLYEDHLDLPDRPRFTLPDLRLAPGVVLEGRVVDENGKGVEGATLLAALDGAGSGPAQGITLPGRGIPVATTAGSGAFRVDQLAAGPWRMIVDAPGFATHEEEGRTDSPGERQGALVFRVEHGFDILGRVRAETGTLPDDLRIGARPSPEREPGPRGPSTEAEEDPQVRDVRARFALCAPDGTFAVHGVRSGVRYALTLSKAGDDPSGWKRVRGTEPAYALAGQRGIEMVYRPESALVFRVLDGRTGTPLTSFSVWSGVGREQPLRDEKNQPVHAFRDGRVRYGDLRPKRGGPPVVLRVAANGFKDLEKKSVPLEPGAELDLGDLALEASCLVRVHVVDDKTGAGIAGARVILGTKTDEELGQSLDTPPDTDFYGESGLRYARTDEGGMARLSSLPGKSAAACAGARGYLRSDPKRMLLPDDRDQDIELRLKHGGTVVVTVRDSVGAPVEGVRIDHRTPPSAGEDGDPGGDRGTLKTDAAGSLRFEALVPGAHGFRISERVSQGSWFETEGQDESEGWIEVVAAEGTTAAVDFVAPSRGGLYGVVREGGRPLEGARLHVSEVRADGGPMEGWFVPGSNDPFAAVADHLGRYRYEGLRCGSYKLQVTHPTRRMSTVVDVEVRSPAGTFDVDLDVAQIEGRVVGEDGSALAGIDVQAHPAGGGAPDSENWRMVLTEDDRGSPRVDYRQEARPAAKTDAAGHYVLRGVRPGEPLAVVASGEMVVHGTVDGVLLGPDEVRRGVDFSLKSAGLVEVTLATGAPAGRGRGWYRVRAVRLGAEGKEEPVQSSYLGDWNRTCRLRSLAPGRYRIEFARGGEEDGPSPDAQEVDVVAGQVARVSFQAR